VPHHSIYPKAQGRRLLFIALFAYNGGGWKMRINVNGPQVNAQSGMVDYFIDDMMEHNATDFEDLRVRQIKEPFKKKIDMVVHTMPFSSFPSNRCSTNSYGS
jgi:hypothetical protein